MSNMAVYLEVQDKYQSSVLCSSSRHNLFKKWVLTFIILTATVTFEVMFQLQGFFLLFIGAAMVLAMLGIRKADVHPRTLQSCNNISPVVKSNRPLDKSMFNDMRLLALSSSELAHMDKHFLRMKINLFILLLLFCQVGIAPWLILLCMVAAYIDFVFNFSSFIVAYRAFFKGMVTNIDLA